MNARLALVLTGLTACMPSTRLQVLQPAEVNMPAEVQRIGIIDRSAPKNVGQHVLGAIEGLFTGEDIGGDRAAADEAIAAVADMLVASPRFDAVLPLKDVKWHDSDVFDRAMEPGRVGELCAAYEVDALVALEAIDSDTTDTVETRMEETTDADGNAIVQKKFDATRDTTVLTSWRTYSDKVAWTVLDEQRDVASTRSWTETGDSRSEATDQLPSSGDTVAWVGRASGEAYGRRIAPNFIWVTRSYYGAGDDRLKAARDHVRIGQWDQATEIWSSMTEDPDTKIAGKALHNLATAAEVRGELELAKVLATEAAATFGAGVIRDYVYTIDARIRDAARLEGQMAPVNGQ